MPVYGWYDHGVSAWWWVFMAVGMLVFWAILVYGLVALARIWSHGRSGEANPRQEQGAQAILRERFARGELSEEEFTHAMQVLRDER